MITKYSYRHVSLVFRFSDMASNLAPRFDPFVTHFDCITRESLILTFDPSDCDL